MAELITCQQCAYWSRKIGTENGWCHRFPPEEYILGDDTTTDTNLGTPMTHESHYCGESVKQ